MKILTSGKVLLLAVVFFSTSCEKDETTAPTYAVKTNIVSSLITGLTESVSTSGPWELGFRFIAHKNGKITSLKLKNPVAGSKRVTLWRNRDKTIIGTYTVNVTNTTAYESTTVDIPLIEGEVYVLTVNVTGYYYYGLPPTNMYPYSHADFTLLNGVFIGTASQSFPTSSLDNIHHGFLDFDFQRTE